MFRYIQASGYGAAIYFISWVVVGKYMLLTLFLAVVLEAFESKYDDKASADAYVAYKAGKQEQHKIV